MQISAANSALAYSIQQSPQRAGGVSNKEPSPIKEPSQNTESSDTTRTAETGNAKQDQGLSEEEKQQVAQLQERDREVRAHEAAHIAASGGLASGASYSYQTGPDGRNYAVGGEVSIDTSPVRGDPQATIQKAKTIRAAALAPAQPSGADQAVAAAASKMEASARVELSAIRAEELEQESEESTTQESTEGKKTTEETSQTALLTRNASSDANQYRDTASANVPSDLIGQLLNASV